MTNSHITAINKGAFQSLTLADLKYLELSNLFIKYLDSSTLFGLDNLRMLRLVNLPLKSISEGTLLNCVNLTVFEMVRCELNVLHLPALTGSNGGLRELKHFTAIRNNFKNTISSNTTFSDLVAVELLHLEWNQIESIGEGVFEPIIKTIRRIDLSKNKLKTLSESTLNFLMYSIEDKNFFLKLGYNEWNCVCKFKKFREFMVQKSIHFDVDEIRCIAPIRWKNVLLKDVPESDLCSNHSILPMNSSSDIEIFSLDYERVACKQSDQQTKLDTVRKLKIITIKKSSGNLRFSRLPRGKFSLLIRSLPMHYFLIGFEGKQMITYNSKIKQDRCIMYSVSGKKTQNIKIKMKFKSNRLYRFCIMKKRSITTSLSDCISFYTKQKGNFSQKNVFLTIKYRTEIYTVWIVVSMISYLSGIRFSFWFWDQWAKIKEKWKRDRRRQEIEM